MAIECLTRASISHMPVAGEYKNISKTGLAASIVIVSYNSRSQLERCLRSVFDTIRPRCEVIVVDNASSDGSADFVAAHFPLVKLVRSKSNVGFAAGNNLGARHAKGRYIIGLNPDTEVASGWVEALLGPLEAAEGQQTIPGMTGIIGITGITTGRVLKMGKPEEVNACGNITHLSGITTCRGLGRPAGAHELAQEVEIPAISGACFAISRFLWDELGGFDETYFTYLEDTDLSFRARLLGYTSVYTPNAVVYHNYTGSFTARKLYYLERNRLMMLLKLYRASTLLACLPALVLTEVLTWAYAVKNGKGHILAKCEAYGWLISNRAEIMSKRAEVQASRQAGDAQVLDMVSWRLDTVQLAGPLLGRIAGLALNPAFGAVYLLAKAIAGKLEDRSRGTRPGRPMTRRASSLASRLSSLPPSILSVIARLRAKEGAL